MKSIYCTAFAALLLATGADAAILVQYNFTAAQNSVPDAASTTGVGVTASTFAANVATVSTTTSAPVPSSRARAVSMTNITDDFDSTGAANYQFSLSPTTAGQSLNLTNLTFVFNVSDTVNGGIGSFRLSYALPSDPTTFIVVGTTETANSTSAVAADFDLSGTTFDDLTAGILFKLDMKDTGSTASTSLRIDNVTVNGDVIPEPGSAMLLATAATGLVGMRRRR